MVYVTMPARLLGGKETVPQRVEGLEGAGHVPRGDRLAAFGHRRPPRAGDDLSGGAIQLRSESPGFLWQAEFAGGTGSGCGSTPAYRAFKRKFHGDGSADADLAVNGKSAAVQFDHGLGER